jgi:hypothetical protein
MLMAAAGLEHSIVLASLSWNGYCMLKRHSSIGMCTEANNIRSSKNISRYAVDEARICWNAPECSLIFGATNNLINIRGYHVFEKAPFWLLFHGFLSITSSGKYCCSSEQPFAFFCNNHAWHVSRRNDSARSVGVL